MTLGVLPKSSVPDAELITASRNGNRDAFGQIVRRYQAMVSGLIYAACGDLHRSEDIAQETFICAWKSLSGLRDAAKLPGWLCQIARHRIADHFREPATQKIQLQQQLDRQQIEDNPADRAALAEENELLWRTLSRIPQPYRETLVLYYRQGRSTSEVAAAMETTDEGVRQRLARGRNMLREEMAAMVERNLAATAPGQEFSLAVVAALPMTAVQSAAVTATAKGSAAAKSGGLLFFLANWLGPIIGLATMGFVTFESLRHAEKGAARKSFIGYWIAFWLLILVWIYACIQLNLVGSRRHWDYANFIYVFSAAGGIFSILLFGLLGFSSHLQSRHPEGRQTFRAFSSFVPRFVFVTLLVYSGMGWIIGLAIGAGDRLSAGVLAALIITGCAVCAWRNTAEVLRRSPLKMAFECWFLMVALNVIALDLRLRPWIAMKDHLNLNDLPSRVPLWSINLSGFLVLLWMLFLSLSLKRRTSNIPT
ncbi:MAG TPA: RNA polymerase sigma factor [Tepidisphaeraceae bacterium]|nr:RNA polymerase sigma factor [Tepidisphaeraceae bacterium]